MATTTKPTGFLRSSENTGEAEAQAAHEVRRLRKLEAAEPRGFDWEDDCAERASLSWGMGSGAAASVLVEPRDLSESWERRIDFMLAEDVGNSFDRDGLVR